MGGAHHRGDADVVIGVDHPAEATEAIGVLTEALRGLGLRLNGGKTRIGATSGAVDRVSERALRPWG